MFYIKFTTTFTTEIHRTTVLEGMMDDLMDAMAKKKANVETLLSDGFSVLLDIAIHFRLRYVDVTKLIRCRRCYYSRRCQCQCCHLYLL